ncbi:MAG TPA: sugar transferase [Acidimicrobiales bacterium]|nr:sugar transferase [Acidimicrobiales bacterium]
MTDTIYTRFSDAGVRHHGSPGTGVLLAPSPDEDLRRPLPTAASRAEALPVKALIVAADLAGIVAAMLVAFHLRSLLPGEYVAGDQSHRLLVGALSLPLWLGLFARYGLYRANKVASRRTELRCIVHAVGASVAAMALVAFVAVLSVGRGWLVLTFVTAVVVVSAEREVIRRVLTRLRRRGRLVRRVLVVGGNADADVLCSTLRAEPALGYHVVGHVADEPLSTRSADLPPVMGSVGETLQVARRSGAQGVIIVVTAVGTAAANRLARELPEAGIHVEVVPTLCDIAIERLSLRSLGRFPVLQVQPVRRQGWRAGAKRAFDLSLACTGLVVAAPVMAVVALAVRMTSPGPVLFRQKRLGHEGQLFEMLKFRTMVANAEELLLDLTGDNEADGPLFKMRNDPRITRVGRHLRKLSLDELPQLWNVVVGDMALVGPRPALPHEITGWSPELHQRLRVKPGITGMWQVSGRSDNSFDDYVRLDLYYVDNWSLLADLTILAQTVPVVLFRRGAR